MQEPTWRPPRTTLFGLENRNAIPLVTVSSALALEKTVGSVASRSPFKEEGSLFEKASLMCV